MLRRALLIVALAFPIAVTAQLRWVPGQHYTVLPAPAPSNALPGRIEVTEAFSYGCTHCFNAQAEMTQIQASLPTDAVMTYLHASFNPAEGWPVFQRGWLTAKKLGIAEALHKAMFAAIWETHEIPQTAPTIEQVARFYARISTIKEADFLRLARSPEIDADMKREDMLVETYRVPGTPALIVNGRYLINNSAVGSWQGVRELIDFLVGQERRRLKLPAPTITIWSSARKLATPWQSIHLTQN
jgi:protein dithiol oxidoreductase (disulfide-forming)